MAWRGKKTYHLLRAGAARCDLRVLPRTSPLHNVGRCVIAARAFSVSSHICHNLLGHLHLRTHLAHARHTTLQALSCSPHKGTLHALLRVCSSRAPGRAGAAQALWRPNWTLGCALAYQHTINITRRASRCAYTTLGGSFWMGTISAL